MGDDGGGVIGRDGGGAVEDGGGRRGGREGGAGAGAVLFCETGGRARSYQSGKVQIIENAKRMDMSAPPSDTVRKERRLRNK